MLKKTILVTGATGLVGKPLVAALVKEGHRIHVLSTRRDDAFCDSNIQYFYWNPTEKKIDERALDGITDIIHLAGASIADKAWTNSRKREILESRTGSAALLYDECRKRGVKLDAFISASAIGYYGDRGEEWLSENELSGADFLAEVCKSWEFSAWQFQDIARRVCISRIGIVLSRNGGALPELLRTMSFGVAGYFTKKPLFTSWVHLDDLVSAFCFLLNNNRAEGSFNLTAPNPIEHISLIRILRDTFYPSAILMAVPSLALTLTMGERAALVLTSQRCSAKKLMKMGYAFAHPTIESAVRVL